MTFLFQAIKHHCLANVRESAGFAHGPFKKSKCVTVKDVYIAFESAGIQSANQPATSPR